MIASEREWTAHSTIRLSSGSPGTTSSLIFGTTRTVHLLMYSFSLARRFGECLNFVSSTSTISSMIAAPQHDGHRAVLLNNGKVLIAGGGADCPNGDDGCAIV